MRRLTSSRSSRSLSGAPPSRSMREKVINGRRKRKGVAEFLRHRTRIRTDGTDHHGFIRVHPFNPLNPWPTTPALLHLPDLSPRVNIYAPRRFSHPRESFHAQLRSYTLSSRGGLRPHFDRGLRRLGLRADRRAPRRPRRQDKEEDAQPPRREAADHDEPARRPLGRRVERRLHAARSGALADDFTADARRRLRPPARLLPDADAELLPQGRHARAGRRRRLPLRAPER